MTWYVIDKYWENANTVIFDDETRKNQEGDIADWGHPSGEHHGKGIKLDKVDTEDLRETKFM